MDKPQVAIDWSGATEEQLGELYDALHERNELMSKALESVHRRFNIGKRCQGLHAMKEELARVSHELAESVHQEILRRYPPSSEKAS